MNFLKNAKATVLHAGTTAVASADIDCTTLVDMSGYEGVLIISSVIETSASQTTGGHQLVPRHSAVNTSTTGITDLGSTGTAGTTALTTNHWGHLCMVDIYKPTKQYITASLNKIGADSHHSGTIIALQYNNRKGPVTQSTAHVISSKQLISPTT